MVNFNLNFFLIGYLLQIMHCILLFLSYFNLEVNNMVI